MSTLELAADARPASRATRAQVGAGVAWAALVGAVCLGSAIVATWPLAAHLPDMILLGTEQDATVGVFSIWTLWWTANRVAHGMADYWDAPFFYPNAGVFTYSEPEPLTGLAVAPLWALGAPPALIHNLALLAVLLLNGVFAVRVARTLAVPRLPALLAGVLMVTLPFVAKEYGVLNLTPVFGLLWALEGLIRFGQRGTARAAGWAAAGLVVAYLTCQQYTLLFLPFAVVGGLMALAQQGWARPAALRLIGAGLGAGVIIGLVAWPAFSLHQALGFTRSDLVVQALSAQPTDFVSRPGTARVPFPAPDGADTAGLFPGELLALLAALGIGVGGRDPARRPWVFYLFGSAVAALVLAFGLNFNLLDLSPFGILRTLVPGFGELRAPVRFALILQMMLPLLAALALTPLAGRWAGKGAALAILLGLLAAGENLTAPPLTPVPLSPRTAWTAWLRDQPADTVVAHIPFPAGLHVSNYTVEAWRLFAQMDHQKPLVNGYSGYFPPGYTSFQLLMAQRFPAADLLCQLNKGLDVNVLVVDQSWLADHTAAMTAQAAFLQPAYSDAQVQIYRLYAPEGTCQAGTSTP